MNNEFQSVCVKMSDKVSEFRKSKSVLIRNRKSHKLNIRRFKSEPHSKHSYFTPFFFFFFKKNLLLESLRLISPLLKGLCSCASFKLWVGFNGQRPFSFPSHLLFSFSFHEHFQKFIKVLIFKVLMWFLLIFWGLGDANDLELLCEWEKAFILNLKSPFISKQVH